MAKLDPIVEFREDHRKVRDGLLDLASAAVAGNRPEARDILGKIDNLVGPHFRYEEESLYPTLRTFLGDYVDGLFREHDGAIDSKDGCEVTRTAIANIGRGTGGQQSGQGAPYSCEQL